MTAETQALVDEWRTGAAERHRLIRAASQHGVGTVAYRRIMAKDNALGRRLLDVGYALRAAGVDPYSL